MIEQSPQSSVLTSVIESSCSAMPSSARVIRADVASVSDSGTIEVDPVSDEIPRFRCDVLESAFARGVRLEVGDVVLALTPESAGQLGCVLGRVAGYRPNSQESLEDYNAESEQGHAKPDHLVIEAEDELTLKCGDASLNLRKDGKVMILGKDVLTRAKRTQRIKGGTVAIN